MPEGNSLLDDMMSGSGSNDGSTFLKALTGNKLEDLLYHSEMPPAAVWDFTTMLLMADQLNSRVLKNFSRRFLSVQVIKDRKRALELVELFQSYTSSHNLPGSSE